MRFCVVEELEKVFGGALGLWKMTQSTKAWNELCGMGAAFIVSVYYIMFLYSASLLY